jgi:hypothetical protein
MAEMFIFLDQTQNYAIYETCRTSYPENYAGTCSEYTGGRMTTSAGIFDRVIQNVMRCFMTLIRWAKEYKLYRKTQNTFLVP